MPMAYRLSARPCPGPDRCNVPHVWSIGVRTASPGYGTPSGTGHRQALRFQRLLLPGSPGLPGRPGSTGSTRAIVVQRPPILIGLTAERENRVTPFRASKPDTDKGRRHADLVLARACFAIWDKNHGGICHPTPLRRVSGHPDAIFWSGFVKMRRKTRHGCSRPPLNRPVGAF